jgi:hypothetical protein
MPPRYAYWTILVDEQPTAFRASSQEDLMPTFKRLKEKNATAKMMWWQNGKLWDSRVDAQEAMHARSEMGRRGDARQAGGFRSRNVKSERRPRQEPEPDRRDPSGKLEWKPKDENSDRPEPRQRSDRPEPRQRSDRAERPEWKPKGSGTSPRPRGAQREERPEWRPKAEGLAPRDHLVRRSVRDGAKSSFRKPEWKGKGAGFGGGAKKEWSPKGPRSNSRPPQRRDAGEKLEWRPKGSGTPSSPQTLKPSSPKRKWVPKEEYKKSKGIEAKRDKNWRPGGTHQDPRQKYKDAKKAKWGRFKQNIRQKWEAKQGPGKKRRDEE